MSLGTRALLFLAAVVGGVLNSVAGGGSFVEFPTLLFAGVAPVPANATNTVALWPAAVASAIAYRRELREVRRLLVPLGIAAFVGGLAGSLLLLRTSDRPWSSPGLTVTRPCLSMTARLRLSVVGSVTTSSARAETVIVSSSRRATSRVNWVGWRPTGRSASRKTWVTARAALRSERQAQLSATSRQARRGTETDATVATSVSIQDAVRSCPARALVVFGALVAFSAPL